MKLKQISVFAENKPGKIERITRILEKDLSKEGLDFFNPKQGEIK